MNPDASVTEESAAGRLRDDARRRTTPQTNPRDTGVILR
jgi:hypothetical protein